MVAALHSWVEKRKINTYKEIKKVTFDNVGKLFVGLQPGQQMDAIDELFRGLVRGVRAYPLNIPGTAYRHALQCKKQLDAIFRGEFEKKKRQHESEKTNDLMDGLMQIEDDEGNKLSDQEVVDNIVGLVVAGYESTSIASMWAIYYLAKYPTVFEKLREENAAVCKNKKGYFITSEDVAELEYTNKVVEETIRMPNIAAFIFRMATREVEYKGASDH